MMCRVLSHYGRVCAITRSEWINGAGTKVDQHVYRKVLFVIKESNKKKNNLIKDFFVFMF